MQECTRHHVHGKVMTISSREGGFSVANGSYHGMVHMIMEIVFMIE